MGKFILRRLVRGLVALFLFQSLLFTLIQALPYDFSSFIIDQGLRNLLRGEFGLDQPLLVQYMNWMLRFLRFDLGTSFLYWPTSVMQLFSARLARTLLLFLSAAVLAYLLGIWLGKMIAWHRGGLFEAVSTIGGVAAYTSFAPWLGFVLINIFAWYLRWLPYRRLVDQNVWFNAPVYLDWLLARMVITAVVVFGVLWLIVYLTRRVRKRSPRFLVRALALAVVAAVVCWVWAISGLAYLVVDVLAHLVLPLSTIVLLSFGETMMTMRTSMLETMQEDYVLMARAKGLSVDVIRDRHVARNAILPVLTRMALNLPFVMVGSLVIERVFMWQAMGQLVFDAIEWQDVPVLMGILSLSGMLALIAHVLLDLLHALLDPRLRYTEVM